MDKRQEFSVTKFDPTRPGVHGSAPVHWKKSKLKSKSWCKLRTNFGCFVVEIAETKR
ncbi:hypothetical protein Hanom_Chr08g00718041 [Helianthus anomalus]